MRTNSSKYITIDKKLSGLDRELMKKSKEIVNNTGPVITKIICDNPKVNLAMLKPHFISVISME